MTFIDQGGAAGSEDVLGLAWPICRGDPQNIVTLVCLRILYHIVLWLVCSHKPGRYSVQLPPVHLGDFE